MSFARALFVFFVMLAGLVGGSAGAVPLRIGSNLCHAVTAASVPDRVEARLRYRCAGAPQDYQGGSLWLSVDPAPIVGGRDRLVLLLHQTRFERLTVFFVDRRGHAVRQQVQRGDYGAYWRVGGQLLFVAPAGDAPLARVTMRFDGLASAALVRPRIVTVVAGGRDLSIAAALIGGALMLLLAGAIYNLSLAAAVRRGFLAWHGCWAACVFIWGMLWSQLALIVVPGVAGTTASQICTFLACLAVAMATMSAISALDRTLLPRWLRLVAILLGVGLVVLGVPAALSTGAFVDRIGPILSFWLLAELIAVTACVVIGWRAGSTDARDLAFAWTVPMLTLAITEFVDIGDHLFGGGSQIAVLFACALQMVWLSIATTVRLAKLRIERDAARAAESEMGELASRDPLTGLLNRRGFIERANQLFGGPAQADLEFALLLIDVDHFKPINDDFGHEAGDEVLCRIADRLKRWERELCLAGRLGGEEFVLAVSGLNAFALGQFADQLRADLGACDHGAVSRQRRVTVSIGVARGHGATTFQRLYGMADRALYEAKRGGRDRVAFHGMDDGWREAMTRDQLAFEWGHPAP